MNKFAATSSGSICDGLGASFPSHNLARGVGRKDTPLAFLIKRVSGYEYRVPLQVIRIKHKL